MDYTVITNKKGENDMVGSTTENGQDLEAKQNLRKHGIFDTVPLLYAVTLILIVFGQTLGTLLEFIPFMTGSDVLVTATLYFEFIGIWALAVLYMRFVEKNRPIIKAIGTDASGNTWLYLLLGVGIGFGLNGLCILAAWLHGDIALYFDAFQPLHLLLIFVAVFIQSSAEELLCRGFLYQRLMRSYGKPMVAIVVNSLFFALMHLMNDGVTFLSLLNIFVVGVLFSLMVYYMDSIWCAMAVHTAWNFTQNILFGLPNSGIVVPYSVFRLEAASARDSFAYNVGFGIEGTLFADVVLILACVGLYLWGRKYGRKPLDVWAE